MRAITSLSSSSSASAAATTLAKLTYTAAAHTPSSQPDLARRPSLPQSSQCPAFFAVPLRRIYSSASDHVQLAPPSTATRSLPPSLRARIEMYIRTSQTRMQRGEPVVNSDKQIFTARVVGLRKHSTVTFVDLLDGSIAAQFPLQLVLPKRVHQAMNRLAEEEGKGRLGPGSVVEVSGVLLVRNRDVTRSSIRVDFKADHGRILANKHDKAPSLVPPAVLANDSSRFSAHHRLRPHLRTLLAAPAATMRLRSRLETAMASWFTERDFVRTNPPIMTASDCEGAGEVFRVVDDSVQQEGASDSEGKTTVSSPAYLTVSTQLHLEALMLGLSRVFTFTPAFRAEDSDTNRHLREFWMCEAEMVTSGETANEHLEVLMGVVEDLIKAAAKEALGDALSSSAPLPLPKTADGENDAGTNSGADAREVTYHVPAKQSYATRVATATIDALHLWDLQTADPTSGDYTFGGTAEATDVRSDAFDQLIDSVDPNKTWPRMTYTAALEVLQRQHETGTRARTAEGEGLEREGGSTSSFFQRPPPTWGEGLGSEHEKWLAEDLVGGPVFITDYPASSKPFYMKLAREDGQVGDAATKEGGPLESREIVKNFDLLIPSIGELVGGSLREDDPKILLRRMRDAGLLPAAPPSPSSGEPTSDQQASQAIASEGDQAAADEAALETLPPSHPLKWYVDDLRRHALPPHGGFGLGVERLVAWLANRGSVRECIPFPRVGRKVRF